MSEKLTNLGTPLGSGAPVVRPNDDALVLAARGDNGFGESDGGRPGDVADPIRMTFQLFLFLESS